MGLLSSLFGGGEDKPADGEWLRGERDSNWLHVCDISNGAQKVELSTDSCYQQGAGGYFCILRSPHPNGKNIAYLGCYVEPDCSDAIYVLVQRVERPTGETLSPDNWSDSRQLSEANVPGVTSAINKVETFSAFNSYSSMPPYVAYLITIGLNCDKKAPLLTSHLRNMCLTQVSEQRSNCYSIQSSDMRNRCLAMMR